MDIKRSGFVFYESWWKAIADLPENVQLDVLTTIMKYGLYGEVHEQITPIAKAILEIIKPQIEANNKRYLNGLKGGCPKGQVNSPNGRNGKIINQELTKPEPNLNQKITKNKPRNNQEITKNKPKEKDKEEVKDKDKVEYISFPKVNDAPAADETEAEQDLQKKGSDIDCDKLMQFFNSQVKKAEAMIPPIRFMTPERCKLVRCRCHEYGKEAIETVIINAVTSGFLNGRKNDFVASFNWIFKASNFLKVLEGNYNDKPNNGDNSTNNAACRWSGRNGTKYKGAIDFDCGLILPQDSGVETPVP